MLRNTTSSSQNRGNQPKDSCNKNELETQEKRQTTNPEAVYELAYIMDPFMRLFFMRLESRGRRFVLLTYFTQATVFLLLLFMFLNFYLSRGARLPRRLVKLTNLKGKVAIVTGGYSGIGLETVRQLLKWNCKVFIFGRNKTEATNAIEKLKLSKSFDEDNVHFVEMDLDDLKSVKKAVETFLKDNDRLDFLINNAGVGLGEPLKDSHGLETYFSSNFLGHFYLTKLLIDVLKKSEGRVISVSSIMHYLYDPKNDRLFETKSTTSLKVDKRNTYYGRSKLFVIWFTHALQRRLKAENSKVLCLAVNPGKVWTKLMVKSIKKHKFYIPKRFLPYLMKDPASASATALYLCAAPSNTLIPGAYYCEVNLGLVRRTAHNEEYEEKLWNLAEEMVKNK
uniref:Oxidoreductase, putative n=1 Tax=Theileria parva TaxID=5875 RepID=Q4N1X1_THEPA|eukprot:XP_764241.1 oxidoreductase [Theileria parva strain Muguga]